MPSPVKHLLIACCLALGACGGVGTGGVEVGAAPAPVSFEHYAKARIRDGYLGYEALLSAADAWMLTGKMDDVQAKAVLAGLTQISKLLAQADAALASGTVADLETALAAAESLRKKVGAALPDSR